MNNSDELFEWHDRPNFTTPVMFYQFDGWIDASTGGVMAMKALLDSYELNLVAKFKSDDLINFRSRRPSVRLVDGVYDDVAWPDITVWSTPPLEGDAGALLLCGPEPDNHWRLFADAVTTIALELGVKMALGFGAFPAPVPHTRPTGIATTTTDTPTSREIAAKIGFVPGSVDVPSGAQQIVESALGNAGVTAVGLWARVPHYLANLPYPAAAVALLEAAMELTDFVLPVGPLVAGAARTSRELDEAIATNDEHIQMVRQLENAYDSGASGVPRIVEELIPTGDELAAEFERFLKNQGEADDSSK